MRKLNNYRSTGFDVPEIDRDFITKKLQTDFSCIPVYLSAEVAERYYNGFSNGILWPFFHCKFSNFPRNFPFRVMR